MSENVEKKYITASMLFGEAIRTDVDEILRTEWAHGPTLGSAAADVVHHNLVSRDGRYSAMPERKHDHARGLLMAGVDDIGRIISPYMYPHNRDRAFEIAHHDDTIQTVAALALNNERHMHEIMVVNEQYHTSYDARINGRGIMTEPSYFPDSNEGCPFAGARHPGMREYDEPRPIFKRFTVWAIDLVLADMDKKGHFEA